jgi:hypothetical protein
MSANMIIKNSTPAKITPGPILGATYNGTLLETETAVPDMYLFLIFPSFFVSIAILAHFFLFY